MKTLLVALLGAIISTTTFAQVLFETDTPLVEVSVRAGKHGWRGDSDINGWRGDSDIKRSYGYQFELNILSQEYLPGLNLRVYGSDTTFNDLLDSYSLTFNEKQSNYGGSLTLTYSFNNEGIVSPYFALGAMCEYFEYEYDINFLGSWYGFSSSRWEDDGVTYIIRCGANLNYYSLFARFEGSLFGEVYKESFIGDDGHQFELLAVVGCYITDWLRIEVAYDYFTEWKEYYLTGGITLRY